MATVADIVTLIEKHIAGPELAESWDNCGLQVGDRSFEVRKIITALDPLESVIDHACAMGADLLITHHPLIFKPLKSIDISSPVGRIVAKALTHRLAIYSAHTSYDSAQGGLNDVLGRKMGITDMRVLGRPAATEKAKLVIFAPQDHKENILGALSETTAGIIGNYTCCSFSCPGQGRFKPGDGARPFSGTVGQPAVVDEVRIETVVLKKDAARVVDYVARVHPYDTMAYDLYPLTCEDRSRGLGRLGVLDTPMSLAAFADRVKQALGIERVKVAGHMDLTVNKVALCSGSGSSLMGDFLKSTAQVYVSGDLHYHDARMVEDAGRALVDIGHFGSEIIMAEAMKEALASLSRQRGLSIEVQACKVERDPFQYI
ncbi:Nif3-like dinuclear metal center hexameric protein [Desulfatiferula olefinivorans]